MTNLNALQLCVVALPRRKLNYVPESRLGQAIRQRRRVVHKLVAEGMEFKV